MKGKTCPYHTHGSLGMNNETKSPLELIAEQIASIHEVKEQFNAYVLETMTQLMGKERVEELKKHQQTLKFGTGKPLQPGPAYRRPKCTGTDNSPVESATSDMSGNPATPPIESACADSFYGFSPIDPSDKCKRISYGFVAIRFRISDNTAVPAK